MRVLGVVGSPRRGGNTEILVDEVLRAARDAGADVEKILLNELEIKPCRAECSDYCKRKGYCKIDDDMLPLYDKLFESDALVLGTPVYWYGPSAQLKAFIDRWYAFSHPKHIHRMKGKRVVLIAPLEETDTSAAKPLVDMIRKSLDYLEARFHSRMLVSAGEKGSVRANRKAMNRAYRIGSALK
ncbi:MAG: flavodoxin family protein [Candidatus Bathyarchaeia archaeon]